MSLLNFSTLLEVETCNQKDDQVNVESNSTLSVNMGIEWNGIDCEFSDWLYIPNLNLSRDYLPPELEIHLPGLKKGDQIHHHYAAGELVERWHSNLLLTIKMTQFKPFVKGLEPITPVLGRFYPKDFFDGVPDIYEGNKFPCRIISMKGNELVLDLNHPLARKAITVNLQIESIKKAAAERDCRCTNIPALICDHGPGMQDELEQDTTDFKHGSPFSRLDERPDKVYFEQPQMTPYWDKLALQIVSYHYQQLIPIKSNILDLMAGVHSPIQQVVCDSKSVSCAGLNLQELESNPVCTKNIQLDVNTTQPLPFINEEFDIVLIHAAIEYVIHPEHLMTEIGRILKPGGKIIISFSNRSEGEKCISLWANAQEFERPGIVLSYLRSVRCFSAFKSYSHRGNLHPEQDALANKLLHSDPVYLVTAIKN